MSNAYAYVHAKPVVRSWKTKAETSGVLAWAPYNNKWLSLGKINRNRKTESKEPESKLKEPEPKNLVSYSVPNIEEPK
jgi:hypothetical protein